MSPWDIVMVIIVSQMPNSQMLNVATAVSVKTSHKSILSALLDLDRAEQTSAES